MAKKTAKATKESCDMKHCSWRCQCGTKGSGGCLYFLGFLGAVAYYIGQATGFWAGVLGFLKALVWPAFLVFKILGM